MGPKTAVTSENQRLGFVLLSCEGKGALLVPGLSVVEEMGLSPCLLPSLSSSQGDLCFKRRKRKKTNTFRYCCLSLLHLIFSLRGMKCIDADNEQH